MKNLLLTLLSLLILCSCSSNRDEPKYDFQVTITNTIAENIMANGAMLRCSASSSSLNAPITEMGIEVYKDGEIIDSYNAKTTNNFVENQFTSLSPHQTYGYRGYARYTNPNTNGKDTAYGEMKYFTTSQYALTLSDNSYDVLNGGRVIPYSSGECKVEISANYSSIGDFTLFVSDTSDFSNLIVEKSLSTNNSYYKTTIDLSQGRYYAKVVATTPDNSEIETDTIQYRVIRKRGTIIEDGMVDLGIGTLWSAQHYTETNGSTTEHFFKTSTISNFEGILNSGDTFSGTQYDNITSKLGSTYRIPTFHDYAVLMLSCKWEEVDDALIISGCTGNAIKIPKQIAYAGTHYFGTSTLYSTTSVWSFYHSNGTGSGYYGAYPYQNLSCKFVIFPVMDE